MSGLRKLLLILILIIFQISALTIGGMTSKALFTGSKPVSSEVNSDDKKAGPGDAENMQENAGRNINGDNKEKDRQDDELTIELEAVVKEDQVEIHKVTKRDDMKLENETTSKITIPQDQLQTGTSAK